MRVPGTARVYEEAVSLVQRRFGNVARVTFEFQGVVGGTAVKGLTGNKSKNRYPTMRIRSR